MSPQGVISRVPSILANQTFYCVITTGVANLSLCAFFFFFLASRHFHFASRTKIMVRDVRLLIAIEQYSKAVFEIIWKCMVLAILLSVIVPKEPRQSQPIRFKTKTRHDWVTRFLIALHAVCLFLLSVLISSVMLLCSDCRIISLRLVLGH